MNNKQNDSLNDFNNSDEQYDIENIDAYSENQEKTLDDFIVKPENEHHHRSHHTDLAHSNVDQTYLHKYSKMVDSRDGKSKSKKRKIKKIIIIVLCVILALCVIAASVFAYLYFSGKSQFGEQPKVKVNTPANVDESGNTILYKGKKYIFDKDVTSILFMGIDKDTKNQMRNDVIGTSGQADAIYLMAVDIEEKKYVVLPINRDTITAIDIYDKNGGFVDQENTQLCLSYAYGDGKETSCENTVKAVQRMLYNVPIKYYFSINRAAITNLNSLVDGVDVPIYDDDGNDTGKIEHLDGADAFTYIKERNTSKFNSNTVRMKRQLAYIKAFSSKAISESKRDISIPVNMYNEIKLYSTTNLNSSVVTYLATTVLTNKSDIKIDYEKIEGKVKKGSDGYAEFHYDTDKLLDTIVSIFYDEVK